MNIIDKIKLLFKVNRAFEEIKQEATKMEGNTPGYKTTEFWLHLAAQGATIWAAVQGFVPPKYAAIVTITGTAIYNIGRVVQKAVADWKSTQGPAPVPTAGATVVVQNNP